MLGNIASQRDAAGSMNQQDWRPQALSLIHGDREALERELMWSIVLDLDPVRREQLCRMLTPAANHTALEVVGDSSGEP